MTNTLLLLPVGVAVSLSVAATVQTLSSSQGQPATPAAAVAISSGLSDLEALTRSCSMAALNAAARRALTVPSQGKYQFSYFNLISDSHHAQYEVHFTSNYEGESVLKYCVEIYCQQGWDPKTAKATITVMSNTPQRKSADPHRTGCGPMHAPAKGTTKRRE
jgi:hypothetical protein